MDFVGLEHQSIIKFLTNETNGPNIIHEWMLAVYDDAAAHFEYSVNLLVQVG
jgi:hypothetical protein